MLTCLNFGSVLLNTSHSHSTIKEIIIISTLQATKNIQMILVYINPFLDFKQSNNNSSPWLSTRKEENTITQTEALRPQGGQDTEPYCLCSAVQRLVQMVNGVEQLCLIQASSFYYILNVIFLHHFFHCQY